MLILLVISLSFLAANSLEASFTNKDKLMAIHLDGRAYVTCSQFAFETLFQDPVKGLKFDDSTKIKAVSFDFGKYEIEKESSSMKVTFEQTADLITLKTIHVEREVSQPGASQNAELAKYVFETPILNFSFPLGYTFRCDSPQVFKLAATADTLNVTCEAKVKITDFRFVSKKQDDDSAIKHCNADFTMNVVVPLVIGGLLCAIIFIVLLVFVVIRIRASRTRLGYEQIIEDQ